MTPPNGPEIDQTALDRWLGDFADAWQDGRLAEFAAQLPPPGHPLRRDALAGLVARDMEQQWRRGRRPPLEGYLHRFPELAAAADLHSDLLLHELRLRDRHGVAWSEADLRRRFPALAAKVLALAAGDADQSILETVGPGEGDPSGPHAAPPPPASEATSPWQAAVPPAGGEPPEDFGRYRIIRRLGQGGMGCVYLARDLQLDRDVAIKVPLFRAMDGPDALERFYQEARAAAALHHPNICPVYDVGSFGGVPFLSMAHVEGRPLRDYLTPNRPWNARQAALLIRKLALTLHEAHEKGVVHRDLKPSNVMMNQRKEPIVMDFGLARRAAPGDARLTAAGQMIGTPAYVSPEQARGDVHSMGPGCDVYSLGVMLYEMLTGRLPFTGSATEVIGQVLYAEMPKPSAFNKGLDPVLEVICLKATHKDVGRRYASAAVLAAKLKGWLDAATAETLAEDAPKAEDLETLVLEPAAVYPAPTAEAAAPKAEAPRPGAQRRRFHAPGASVADLAGDLQEWLRGEGFDCQDLRTEQGGVLIQARRQGGWRALVGMPTVLNVTLHQGGDEIAVEVGGGQWLDKAVAGVVSLFSLWPHTVTAVIGAWNQTRIPERVFERAADFAGRARRRSNGPG